MSAPTHGMPPQGVPAQGVPPQGVHYAQPQAVTDSRPPRRLSKETKSAFKTTEFLAYIGAVAAVVVVSLLVKKTGGHPDYFRADRAMFYIVLLTLGYMGSRGLAKSGSRDFYDSERR